MFLRSSILLLSLSLFAFGQTARRSVVTASGEGVISVKPDQARVSVNVQTRAATAQQASDQNAQQTTAVLAQRPGLLRTRWAGFAVLAFALAIFNLIPMPPLDGAGVVSGLVPASRSLYRRIQSVPYSALVVFVLASYWLPQLYLPVYLAVDDLLPYSTVFD